MNLTALSFSHAENSLQTRGLILLNHFLQFTNIFSLKDFSIPLCFSNKPDGQVPQSVLELDDVFLRSDALLFAISEAGGHYSASFKNVIDWLIVKYRFNSQLGRGYSLSQKPIYIVTFTPTHQSSGDRHFPMTCSLLSEKFGANIRRTQVFHRCWEQVVPQNYSFVESFCIDVLDDCKLLLENMKTADESKVQLFYDTNKWLQQYQKWDEKWTEL